MRRLTRQRGMSPLAWIAILLVVGFFAYFGSRVVPAYVNYYSLVDVVEGVANDRTIQDTSVGGIRNTVRKRMRLNDVDKIGEDAVTVERRGGKIVMEIDYQVRRALFGNIDVCMRFQRRYER